MGICASRPSRYRIDPVDPLKNEAKEKKIKGLVCWVNIYLSNVFNKIPLPSIYIISFDIFDFRMYPFFLKKTRIFL